MTGSTGTGRGGARPGAGRKKKRRAPYKPKPIFDVVAELQDIPGGVRSRTTKTVLALAAHCASDEVIAAALATDLVSLRAVHGDDLARGRAWMEGNARVDLWRMARGVGNRPPSVSALIFFLRRCERDVGR